MKKRLILPLIVLLVLLSLGTANPVLARSSSTKYDALVKENLQLKAMIADLMRQIAILQATTNTPTATSKDTLYVYPTNSSAIKFKNVDYKTANALCATLGGGDYSKKASTCTYANKTLSSPTSLGYKDGANTLTFVTPRSGKNDTISLNDSRYTFTVRDNTISKVSAPLSKYRIFGFYYSPNRYDRASRIYEFNIISSRSTDNKIYLESDLTIDGGSGKPTPGNYYFYAVNAETGDWTTVSAFTYITAATTPTPTPVAPKKKTVYCSADFAIKQVWGTFIYTDDSDVCTAAAHAGMISRTTGGTITYTTTSGQSSYAASTRNGIQSGAWGTWSGSFIFEGSASQNTAPSISVTSPSSGQTIIIGNPIPVKWSYTNIPKNSQIITKLEIIQDGVAAPVSTWQSPEISGNGTYTYPGGWKTDSGNNDTPGTYRITSHIRKCGEAGCNFYYPEYDAIPPSALGTPIEFILKN